MAWTLASPAAGAESRLFSDTAPLKIVLTAPFPELVHLAAKSPKPYPATLSVTDGAAAAQTIPIKLTARGLTRRTGGYCKFPPLSLGFDKATVHETVFKGQDKLKLVTYCQNQADYEQRIMLEYLAYKLYNTLTPISYRVRAAQVTYRDSEKDGGVTRFGYVIEDLSDVAARNKAKKLKLTSHQIKASQFDAHAAGRAALFEFMIANLDWDFLAGPAGADCCHNSRFVAPKETAAALTGVVPIPYDFDYSGFVDAPYAVPPEGLKLERVTQRLYRGYCVSSAEMPALIGEYRAHRAEMTALINAEPGLTPNFRAKAVKFLDGFYDLLDDPGKVDSQIVKHCRQGGA
jgi:hypothetical protein